MRRSLLFLSALFLLSGCESEFDKCMNAELPRAKAGLRPEIEEAEKHLAAAELRLSRDQALIEIMKPVSDWYEQNPMVPPRPGFTCKATSADWDQCYDAYKLAEAQWEIDVQPWRDLRDEVFIPLLPQLKTAGFEGSTYDEVFEDRRKYIDQYWDALVVRGQELDCWGREDCDEYWDFSSAEREYLHGDDPEDWGDDEWIEWEEAEVQRVKQHFTNKIASIKANASEIATLTCNRAGIYE